jgi:hypothetical protein
MTAISLWFLVGCAVCLSALLALMNYFAFSASTAAAATVAFIVVTSAPLVRGLSNVPATPRFLFAIAVCAVPSLAVFAVSQTGWLRARPAWLLGVGPLSYVFAVALAMTAYNVFAATGQRS